MGTVYLGRRDDGRLAAIKVVHDALSHQDEFRTRFRREAALLGQVSSPFTARLLGMEADAPQPWIAMEYVPGPTLDAAIREQGPITGGMGTSIAVGVAAGISRLHAAGIVHRDLKPGNVIIGPHGPVIVDLGIAKVLDSTAVTLTGQRLGTMAWMAPEQIEGRAETGATDVFARGCLMAWALSGAHPFGGGRAEAVALRITSQDPDLSRLSDRDPSLVEAIRAALAKDPSRRPSMPRLVEQLTGASGSGGTVEQAATVVHASWSWVTELDPEIQRLLASASEDALTARVSETTSHPNMAPRGGPVQPPRGNQRRPRPLWWVAGAFALIGVIAAAIWTVPGLRTDPTAQAAGDTPTSSAPPMPDPDASAASQEEIPTPVPDDTSEESESATSGASSSPSEPPSSKLTINAALSAARDLVESTCPGCWVRADDWGAQESSAPHGWINVGIGDTTSYDSYWGFDGATWREFYGPQDEAPLPTALPARIQVCSREGVTNIRSGPSSDRPVVHAVSGNTWVTATTFHLTRAADGVGSRGEGWFEVTGDDAFHGWVTSELVSEDCELNPPFAWRGY